MQTGSDPWPSSTQQVRREPTPSLITSQSHLLIATQQVQQEHYPHVESLLSHPNSRPCVTLDQAALPAGRAVTDDTMPFHLSREGKVQLHRSSRDGHVIEGTRADGKLRLASASQDKTLRVWSMQASSGTAAAAPKPASPDSRAQPSSELAQMIARRVLHCCSKRCHSKQLLVTSTAPAC